MCTFRYLRYNENMFLLLDFTKSKRNQGKYKEYISKYTRNVLIKKMG